jgi:hypothetical protein
MNLFTPEGESEDDGSATAPELATAKQVRLLEGFNYRREAVRKWTQERAETVLRSCQREQRIALARAEAKAGAIDAAGKRGQPSIVERLNAATYVEQMLRAGDADELLQAVMYSLYVCTDDELKQLAAHVATLWRTPSDNLGSSEPGGGAGVDGGGERDGDEPRSDGGASTDAA